jgi:hypothetical protein
LPRWIGKISRSAIFNGGIDERPIKCSQRKMADYYPLLAKAVAGLPDSTAEKRDAIYLRARKALFTQLRTLDPPVPEEAIEREAQSLERAIAQLETEFMSLTGPESGELPSETDFAGYISPAATVPADEPSAATRPKPASQDKGGPGRAPPAPARTLRPPAPPLKVRRDPSGPSAAGHAAYGQAAVSASDLHPLAAEASGPEASFLNTPSYDSFAPESPSASAESYDEAARTRIEPQRPFAPRPEGNTGRAKRIGIVAAIVGLVVALVAIAAFKLRDRPEDLLPLRSASSAIPGEAGSGGKIIDRIDAGSATPGAPAAKPGVPSSTADRNDAAKSGPGPANPAIPVARRAALLMEAPEEQSKVKAFLGTVIWRVDNVSNGPDEPLSMAVRAEVDIPEQALQAAIIIQKNFDSTLPASHTMKLSFSVRPDSPLANLKQVSVLLRREDTPTGDALKGITVPVTDNSFLIGLSRGEGEASNIDLLRSREWFDIPMVLANGHIAKLTFEKGASGRNALDDAMASWRAQ